MYSRGLVARHGSLQACGDRLGWFAWVHKLVLRVHGSIVGLLRTVTASPAVGSTIRQNDRNIQDIHRLSREKGAFGRHRLVFINGFYVIIQQILILLVSSFPGPKMICSHDSHNTST